MSASLRSSVDTSLGSIPSTAAIFSLMQFHLKSNVDLSPNFAHDTAFRTWLSQPSGANRWIKMPRWGGWGGHSRLFSVGDMTLTSVGGGATIFVQQARQRARRWLRTKRVHKSHQKPLGPKLSGQDARWFPAK